jgi:hypothetical protein
MHQVTSTFARLGKGQARRERAARGVSAASLHLCLELSQCENANGKLRRMLHQPAINFRFWLILWLILHAGDHQAFG